MRDLWASIALNIITHVLDEGGKEMMAMLFAIRVVEGRTEFEKVPAKLKAQVAQIILTDFELPEIVPTEYGGTAE